jgi:putative ABC transport system ATP-binding protein
MSVLAGIAKDPNRAVLVVAHDPRIIPFADRVVRIEDGLIVGEEQRRAGRYEKGEVDLAVLGRRKR